MCRCRRLVILLIIIVVTCIRLVNVLRGFRCIGTVSLLVIMFRLGRLFLALGNVVILWKWNVLDVLFLNLSCLMFGFITWLCTVMRRVVIVLLVVNGRGCVGLNGDF